MLPRSVRPLFLIVCLIVTGLLTSTQRVQAKEFVGAISPVWSPDGKQIAFVFQQQEKQSLYLLDVNSPTPTKVADNASQPAWSPDGKKLAYVDDNTLSIFDVAQMKSTSLTMGYIPKWSPDGTQILYLVGGSLHLANVDVTTPRRAITDPKLTVWDFWWSPDGKQIAFTAQGANQKEAVYYVSDKEGKSPREIAKTTTMIDTSLSWSPDSRQLAYIGKCGGKDQNDLCIMNTDGSNPHLVSSAYQLQQPKWSPDGKQILLSRGYGLWVVNIDGSNARFLTPQAAYSNDTDAAWSPDGKQIVFSRLYLPQGNATEPYQLRTEVYVINADGSGLRQIADKVPNF